MSGILTLQVEALAKGVILAPCPSCSSFGTDPFTVRRPGVVKSRKADRWSISCCCVFSSALTEFYSSPEAAAADWDDYRQRMAKTRSLAGFPRLFSCLDDLQEWERLRAVARAKAATQIPVRQPDPPAAPVAYQQPDLLPINAPVRPNNPASKARNLVPQTKRRAPGAYCD